MAEKVKEKGIRIYHLNIGQPDLEIPEIVFKSIRNYQSKTIPYAPSEGFRHIINAWRKYYKDIGLNFEREEIIITTGGSEAIIFAMAAICDPGDEILVFEPFYTNYNGFASITSCRLVPITLSIENGFHLPDNKVIEKKITKRTKGIIICNPNNPTGAVYTKKELSKVAQLAKKYKLFIINDEVYREFVYDNNKFYSLFNFKEIKNQIILIDSVSKRFNLCGARIGCLACHNRKIMANIMKFAQARLSSPTLEQLILVPLLENSKNYLKKLIFEYKKRRNVIIKMLKKIPGLTYRIPEGAFYVIVGLPIKNAEHFCEWLLDKFCYKNRTLMLAPAAGFYKTRGLGKNEVRIGFVINQKDLEEALKIFKIALEKYKNKYG